MRRRKWLGLIVGTALAKCAAGPSLTFAQGMPRNGSTVGVTKRAPQPNNSPAAIEAREKEARLEQLLGLWETQSSRLKTLDVDIERVDKSRAFPDEEDHFLGRAILQAPNFAFLNLEKVILNPKTKKKDRVPFNQIRCTGDEVWQYKPDTKQIFIYPLGKDQRQRALEEGPLRFLFNMRKADVKARYQVDLIKEEKTFYVISVIPTQPIDQESFSKAFLQLESLYLLPTRIVLISPSGKDSEDYTLTNHKANKPVNDANFKGVQATGWDIKRNPGEGLTPAQAKARGLRPGVRQQPTTRGANAPERR